METACVTRSRTGANSASQDQQVQQLKEQVEELTAQVANLVHQATSVCCTSVRHFFYCDRFGYFQMSK